MYYDRQAAADLYAGSLFYVQKDMTGMSDGKE